MSFAFQPQAVAPVAVVAEAPEEPKNYGIVTPKQTNEPTSFYIESAGLTDHGTALCKELKGGYNARIRGYIFPASSYQLVCNRFGITSSINILDPTKRVRVEFSQDFQWDSDPSIIEEKFKKIGMKKKITSTGGSVFYSDLSLVQSFSQTFAISLAQPAAQNGAPQ